jgi:gamma-glutamyltranspeptidase/glutathione hydrolase
MRTSRPIAAAALFSAATLVFAAPGALDAQSVGQSGRSPAGMVSAAHPLATDAGVRILEMGGNAADAAIAAAFAIAIVEPTMNSIGGRTQVLVGTADGGFHGIDGTTQAPWDYDADTAPQASYGYPVIGIPGAVAGLMKLHEDHGSLPLDVLMEPAIEYAENGFRVLAGDELRMMAGAEQALEFPGTRDAYYKDDGSAYGPGEILKQPDYANTLRRIRDGGAEVFYEGEIAEAMIADLQANGSVMNLQALRDYEAEESRIVRGSYRGYDLIGTDVPAAGVLVIQALHIMETFEPSEMTEAEWFAITGQALGMARGELRVLGSDTAAERATSKEYARRLADEIRAPAAVGAHDAVQAPAGLTRPLPVDDRGDLEGGHTTHLSTADADGMVVSLTQTLGPNMGSKVVTPGLGFLYASTLGGYLGRVPGGFRARSNIAPFVVMKDGEIVLVLGGAGGGMIPPAIVHAITRVIDFGLELPQALAEPRVAASGDGYNAETSPGIGWTEDELAEMRALGIDINVQPRSGAFGRIHGIQFDPETDTWIGAADPDWEGTARGPRRSGG